MSHAKKLEFIKGNEVVNYSTYFNQPYEGFDRVLQHKIAGVETAHVAVHPGSKPQVTVEKAGTKPYLKNAVNSKLLGFEPVATHEVLQFMSEVNEIVAAS